jgi:phosphoglycolate phosphatase-like HAD superfamily hydrolase
MQHAFYWELLRKYTFGFLGVMRKGHAMHLIMFDLDGTLLKSNTLDEYCFSGAMISVMGIENIQCDWSDYQYVTDEGIVSEIVSRQLHRPATKTELSTLRTKILELLRSQALTHRENFAPLPGALDLFYSLKKHRTCGVAIATGCWKESAILKLSTAGFDTKNLPMAFSDDSHRREDIMHIACTRALDFWGVSEFETVTYVGDGVWDLHASKKLGYHFIGIGSYNNEARLLQEGASFIINDYSDQKTFFAQMDKIWSRNNGNKWLTRF